MRGYLNLKRFRPMGISLHVHWTVLVAGGIMFGAFIRQPVHALLFVLSYFGVILLHEFGHVFVARRLGYSATDIYVTFIHGVCVYEAPDSEKEDAMIAWGGVLLQLIVAIPLIVVSQSTQLGLVSQFAVIVAVFGYFSVIIALLNLVPSSGLDGAMAWRLVPILFKERRHASAAKKVTNDILRKFK